MNAVINAMCGKKATFRTRAKAQEVADKFNQRVYECPVCFCWHCTSAKDWKSEYVTRAHMNTMLAQQESKIRGELNEKNRKLTQEVFELHKKLKEARNH